MSARCGTGFSARRLLALARKEGYQILRDPSSILIAFILPPLLIFLNGYALSLDIEDVRLGLVVEDTSPEARELAAAFTASPYFDVEVAHSRAAFEERLVQGSLRGMAVIPQTYSRDLRAPGGVATVQVVADGSEPNTANFVQNYASGVVRGHLSRTAREQGLPEIAGAVVEPRVWYNTSLESKNFLVPGSIGIILTLIGTLLTALVVSREWERGTMEALMATPVSRGELILGKLLPYFLLGMGSLLVSLAMVLGIFDVPLRGSLSALFLVSGNFMLAALAMGLFISTLARNQFVASQTALLAAYLPAFLLSGFVYEINSMPAPIRALTHLIAARYYVSCLQTIFLTGDVWEVLLPNMAGMSAIALAFFALTFKKTAKRLD